jgi:hypothetical protein
MMQAPWIERRLVMPGKPLARWRDPRLDPGIHEEAATSNDPQASELFAGSQRSALWIK